MKNCIGIRKENKYDTERRAPLTPAQVGKLIDNYAVRVIVEPSTQRVFTEAEYQAAGAEISEDLSNCNIVFGVKEIPLDDLQPGPAYCFFSHTIKAQPYNMPMLKTILDRKITLLDYEVVTNRDGRRQIFFGNFAGYAGMLNSLWTMGQRLAAEGFKTPLADVKPAYQYDNLQAAMDAVKAVGNRIREEGLPKEVTPLVCGFTGYGQVSKAAQQIYELLPTVTIAPEDLADFVESGDHSENALYRVEFYEKDMFAPKDTSAEFDLQDYFSNPEKYKGIFEQYVPYLSMVVNGIYWTPECPRLITKSYLKALYQKNNSLRLRVIGDITCDIDGSIEMTVKSTKSNNPVYVFDPLSGETHDGVEGNGPVVMAVDILPTELPREASDFFGNALMFYLPNLAAVDFDKPFEFLEVAADFRKSIIAHAGGLAPNYKYLSNNVE